MKETNEVAYKCPYCDSVNLLVIDETLNCPNCGAPIRQVEEPKKPINEEIKNEEPKQRKSIFKRWWFWVVIGVSILLISLPIIIGVTLSNFITNNMNNAVEVNEWAYINDYQIRVIEVENTKEFGNSESGIMKTNDNYVCLLIEIKNNSSNFEMISSTNFKVKNKTNSYGISLDASNTYSKYKADYSSFGVIETLDSEESFKYYMVFETEDSTTDSVYKLQYKDGFKNIIVKL